MYIAGQIGLMGRPTELGSFAMSTDTNTDIAGFIADAELAETPPSGIRGFAGIPTLASEIEQGAIVDSNVVTYRKDIPEQLRNDVANWLFLAQRVATKKVPDISDAEKWTDEYYKALLGSGWVTRGQMGSFHKESVKGSNVHENILRVATVLLAPASAALAIVTAAVTALGDMDKGSPWITLFNRRAEDATAVGFQVADCTPHGDGGASLECLDFQFYAHKVITKVLFFTFESERAELRRRRMIIDLTAETIEQFREQIATKVREKIADNIAAYDI